MITNAGVGTGQKDGLGVIMLTALVVGSMIGSGIFSIPQNMAEGAGAGAILLAWCITFFGMLLISWVFQSLALKRPEIQDSFYGYAKIGFGDYIGMNAAWGHWISTCIGNVGYLIIIFSAFGSFAVFSVFGDGTTTPALLCELVVLGLMYALILQGVKTAAFVNTIVTLAKVVPIVLFVIVGILFFKVDVAKIDFWGSPALGGIMDQIKTTMLYTVWEFIGIESANVYSSRAKHMKDVSRATFLGFIFTFMLLVCVSVLSLGIVPQAELAHMKNPSMAGVIAKALGPGIASVINIGLIISVLGALLVWIMLSAEYLSLASKGDAPTVPSMFSVVNKHRTPINALNLSCGFVVVLLFIAHFYGAGYNKMVMLSTSMALIPYLTTAAFVFKLTQSGKWSDTIAANKTEVLLSIGSMIYAAWLIYAAGLRYLQLGAVLYAPAIVFFYFAKRERKQAIFDHGYERGLACAIVIAAVSSIVMMATGNLKL